MQFSYEGDHYNVEIERTLPDRDRAYVRPKGVEEGIAKEIVELLRSQLHGRIMEEIERELLPAKKWWQLWK